MNRNKKLMQYFSKKAIKYDKETHKWDYAVPNEFFKFISQYLKDNYQSVLDIGVGTGQSSIPFIKEGKEVYGIDFSEKMIKQASKYNFKELKLHDIKNGLPYQDNFFDMVISVSTLNLHKNLDQLITEMVRITKDKGLIGFTVEKQDKKQSKKWFAKEAKLYIYRHSKSDIINIIKHLDVKLIGEDTIVAYKLPPAYKEKNNIVYYCYALRKF